MNTSVPAHAKILTPVLAALGAVGLALLGTTVAGPAHTTPGSPAPASLGASGTPEPPTVQLLSRGTIEEPFAVHVRGIELSTEDPIDVATAHLTFAVDGSTGWHKHLGPTVVTMITGELTVTDRKCRTEVFQAGDAFVERGPRRHLAVNTAGTTTETTVTFYAPEDAPALTVPAAAPACAD